MTKCHVIDLVTVIEEANWLTLKEDVQKPGDGFDAVICLGNSFAHLPDFKGNYERVEDSEIEVQTSIHSLHAQVFDGCRWVLKRGFQAKICWCFLIHFECMFLLVAK